MPTSSIQPSSEPGAQEGRMHPLGLYTLFFTEMWERFSYYGMRALLVLFMVDAVRGGMGLTDKVATSIYGLYTAAVYLASLPGGWLSDRLLGPQRSVWYGGMIIALGHFTLAIPRTETFFLGLVVVVVGTGMLKPNMSALVGDLYPEGGARRDAGFTIFYMGVNLGAALGPLLCSTLGEKWNWHYGFAAAGVGMVLGLIQFHFSRSLLGPAGPHAGTGRPLRPIERFGSIAAIGALVIVVALGFSGILKFDPVGLARKMAVVIVAIGVLYFTGILVFGGLDKTEKERVGVIVVLFFAAALFWAGFEQAGSTLNLFAERYTTRQLSWFHFEIPAGWFQSLGAIFIIAFAPVVAYLWVRLARRKLDPSLPLKFALGLFLLASGFLVMAAAAKIVAGGGKAAPTWLIITYLLHTFGELCLSPVGLSSVTKLAPRRFVGQMMGTWFLANSFGNLMAGLIASEFKADAVASMPAQYLKLTIMPAIAGLILILIAKPIHKWMKGVH